MQIGPCSSSSWVSEEKFKGVKMKEREHMESLFSLIWGMNPQCSWFTVADSVFAPTCSQNRRSVHCDAYALKNPFVCSFAFTYAHTSNFVPVTFAPRTLISKCANNPFTRGVMLRGKNNHFWWDAPSKHAHTCARVYKCQFISREGA